jgi:hypothetical protein
MEGGGGFFTRYENPAFHEGAELHGITHIVQFNLIGMH